MKSTSRTGIAASLTLAVLGVFASIASAQVMTSDGVLVGPNKMTLYTFDNDVAGSGKSMCNGACASNWPPLMATDADKAAGDFSVISRDDGKKQWAVKGKPVYYWSKDSKPGDKTGDGINQVWHTAMP